MSTASDSKVRLEFDRLYLKEATQQMIGLKDKLNGLLHAVFIFAGLFSGINAAVLGLSVPGLSNNPGDETNRLLRLLILQRINDSSVTAADLPLPPFHSSSININSALSASLLCAILASLGALMAMRWLTYFDHVRKGTPEDQRLEIQRKLDGASWWHLSSFVASLFGLLELTVILFAVAWIGFLHGKNNLVGHPNNGLAYFGLALVIFPTCFAVWDATCPFHTPVSLIVIPSFYNYLTLLHGVVVPKHAKHADHPLIIASDSSAFEVFRLRHLWSTTWPYIQTPYRFLCNRHKESDDIIDLKSICWAIENASDEELLRVAAQRISAIREDHRLDFILQQDATTLLQRRFLYLYQRHAIDIDASRPSEGSLYGHAIMHLIRPQTSDRTKNIIIPEVLVALEALFGFRR